MAFGVPGFVRIGAALAGCALVAACTPEPGPTTTPTAGPTVTASPSASATPTETEIERQQREDFEAAETAYRSNVAEQQRLARLGVAESTAVLRETSQGEYLRFALQGLKDVQDAGWHARGSMKVVGITRGGWQPDQLHLTACEDGSAVRFIDKSDRDVTPSDLIRTFVQDLTVVHDGSRWKLSEIRSQQVESFEGTACDD